MRHASDRVNGNRPASRRHGAPSRSSAALALVLIAANAWGADPAPPAPATDPDSVAAHLERGRAYLANGEYARARIEFETVLDYDNLPDDLYGQAQVYDQVAAEYAAGREWRPFYYAEGGAGQYRENASRSTDLSGGAGEYDSFLALRVGGGVSTDLGERHTFNGTLDYRFRRYDEADRRDDRDLRWNLNAGRPMGDASLRYGVRGRVSYRGNGQYRDDWGAFTTYRRRLAADDQIELGAELRERRYPRGPQRSRTRDIAELTGSWTHSLADGRTSVGLGGQLTREWATQNRPDGDATFWGVNGRIDHVFRDGLDAFFWWSYVDESYEDERPDPSTDERLLRVRNDDLWNFGAGLVWNFGSGWSLRPTVEYNWEESNIAALAYSSTEYWVTVRRAF